MFSDIADQVEIVVSDDGRAWIPEYGINTLGSCYPGEGYMVMVSSSVTHTYPAVTRDAAQDQLFVNNPGLLLETEHFTPVDPTGMPFAIVCNLADGTVLEAGDEIAVFDGDLCVGAVSCTGEWPLALTAWRGDPANSLEGFLTGNPMSFRVWQSSEDLEEVAAVNLLDGNGQFGVGPYSSIEIQPTSLDLEAGLAPACFALAQNYPNPFNPVTSISFTLSEPGRVKGHIINMMGQEMEVLVDQLLPGGDHKLVWDASEFPTGIYFFKLDSGTQVEVIKMTLLR